MARKAARAKFFSAARTEHHAPDQKVFCGRYAGQRGESRAAQAVEDRDVVRKQPDQCVREQNGGGSIETSFAQIAINRRRIARIGDRAHRTRQFPRIAQSEIETLPRYWMQGLRRVADQHDARRERSPREFQAQRKHLACARAAKSSERRAEQSVQFRTERGFVERR